MSLDKEKVFLQIRELERVSERKISDLEREKHEKILEIEELRRVHHLEKE